jgi:hypothetical protein
MARWQSGHAAACKAVYAGSIPTLASIADKTKKRPCGAFLFFRIRDPFGNVCGGMTGNVARLVAGKMETSKSESAFTCPWFYPTVV